MRSKLAILMALALVLTVTVGPGVAASDGTSSSEANEEQTGRTVSCLTHQNLHNALGQVTPEAKQAFVGVWKLVTDSQVVEVEAGTGFEVSAEDGSQIQIGFYNDQNERVGNNNGPTGFEKMGTVPEGATWASVCVTDRSVVIKTVPNPVTQFHYQDGFPAEQ